MELGISPIVSAGMIIQLLTGLKIIACDTSLQEDRELMETASKSNFLNFFVFLLFLVLLEIILIRKICISKINLNKSI